MHVFERMFRRAALPIPNSQGFNPRPRMWFALSLALGVAGLNEVLEIELAEALSAEELQTRLQTQCPPGIEILSARAIGVKASAHVRRAWYRLPLCPARSASGSETQQACNDFLSKAECWIDRIRPHARRVNVRPFVSELRVGEDSLTMALWITPTGAARPDEVIAALGLQSLLDAGAVVERIDLEIEDECPPGTSPAPRIEGAMKETVANDIKAETDRPHAIMDHPLSFES